MTRCPNEPAWITVIPRARIGFDLVPRLAPSRDILFTVKVLYHYSPVHKDELSLKPNDIIHVTRSVSERHSSDRVITSPIIGRGRLVRRNLEWPTWFIPVEFYDANCWFEKYDLSTKCTWQTSSSATNRFRSEWFGCAELPKRTTEEADDESSSFVQLPKSGGRWTHTRCEWHCDNLREKCRGWRLVEGNIRHLTPTPLYSAAF